MTMEDEENKKPFDKISFDDYIFIIHCNFSRAKGDIGPEYQKHLTDYLAHLLSNASNRNPEIVSGEMWVKILERHFEKYNYN